MRHCFTSLLLICVTCAAAHAADEGARRSITTSGEATVYVTPDQAEISVGVQTYDRKLDDAKTENDKSANSLLGAVKALNVDEKQISTSDVNVSIEYDNYSRGSISGYTVRREYVIKLNDMKLVPLVVDAALHHGANQLSGVNFSSTQLRKYRDQARKMAAKAAKEKAADLAGEFDTAVGAVRTVTENSGVMNYFMGNRFAAMSQNSAVSVGDNAAGGSDETIPPGQIAIRASVSATFDLLDGPAGK